MTAIDSQNQPAPADEFILHPHRSLNAFGFKVLMICVGVVSIIVGAVFLLMGAWPITGFFGLDAALLYWAFRANYRAGEIYERIALTPALLKFTRVYPSGQREEFDCNPYWARVRVDTDRPDGRTSMWLRAEGREIRFGQFLTDDERRAFADALTGALVRNRSSFA